MKLKLENLKYQENAIKSIVKDFEGTEKNTFDNACVEGIRSNKSRLTLDEVQDNMKNILFENGINQEVANLSSDNDICVEMEAGTGKTLVYIKTIYELFKHYGFKKFIILVPSVAIRQNIIGTFKSFDKQLENIYDFMSNDFEYNSKNYNLKLYLGGKFNAF